LACISADFADVHTARIAICICIYIIVKVWVLLNNWIHLFKLFLSSLSLIRIGYVSSIGLFIAKSMDDIVIVHARREQAQTAS